MAIIPSSQRLGEILVARGALRPDDVTQVLAYQAAHPVRFGEAAVLTGFVDRETVAMALSHQFGYLRATPDRRRRSPELTILHQPNSLYAESVRATRAQLLLHLESASRRGRLDPRTLAVVSAESGEGRTHLVANLAVALAQLGHRTLIIDANFRSPRQHQVFDLAVREAQFLADDTLDAVTPIPDIVPLFLLPTTSPIIDPLKQLENLNLTALLNRMNQQFDYVLMDTPAYTAGPDVLKISSECDAALLIVRPQHTRTSQARSLMEALHRSHTSILGTVIHNF